MLIAPVTEMSDNSINEKKVSAFNTHESGWVNIDLEPRRAEATVIDHQVPAWTGFDLEANALPKKRFWSSGKKSKMVVGTAVAAMVLTGIVVPMVIAIRNEQSKGIQ